jgi:hypothetical protein
MTTPFPFVAGAVLEAQQLNDIQNLSISDKTASYVLAVTDVYKRTIMNAAGATTITVNDSIFTVGDIIQVANKGAGTCTITAGVGVTINTSSSLALAQYGGGYLLCLSASTFTFFNLGGIGYGAFTGGANITDGGVTYSYLGFNSSGSVVVTREGLFDVLVVAGGAGASGNIGGGGGGGGVISKTVYLTAATYTVTVGSGGSGGVGSASGTSGNPSSLNVFAALGGGRSNFNAVGTDGGSGGGGWASLAGGAAQAQQGSAGGTGGTTSGGGGGGNTAVGANGSVGAGGNGGAGLTTTFSGSSLVFGSGGGGGGNTGGTGGTNAGNGGANAANGTAGTANFGGGGGGGGNSSGNGANGGSGFVAIRVRV